MTIFEQGFKVKFMYFYDFRIKRNAIYDLSHSESVRVAGIFNKF
ncbi:MAG: hypothetical protein K0R36_2566 [Chryseobacterium sp.]|jgi:hypothetical protein|nr:hypothetical protein [Chryseobacterium sp.]MDF2933235.1 hypothetical protein [Chryseobacterium sp.]